jgi:hypothetical protein
MIGLAILSGHDSSLAKDWGSWQGKWDRHDRQEVESDTARPTPGQETANQNSKASPETATEKRFCSYEQEEELLELLKELEDPSLVTEEWRRGESEVRRRYRIARKLRQFDDCRAEDALKELIKENACEDLGEGEIFCVKWGASSSLQEVKSKKDMKKLTPETPLAEQLKVIKKYGPHPHENEYASHAVMQFLIEQAATNPKVYVPLLVEYFTRCHEIIAVTRKYPKETNIGLKRCFYSTDPTVVWAGINLARTLNKIEFFPVVYDVAFEQKGPLDYSQQEDIEEIQTMAIGFFRMDEKAATPYFRGILYGDFNKGKEYVVSGIKDLTNSELLSLLKEFSSYLQNRSEVVDELLAERMRKVITRMEGAQK